MMKILALLLALLAHDVASAEWLRVPVYTDAGVRKPCIQQVSGQCREHTNDIKAYSGQLIRDGAGNPLHYIIWVNEDTSGLTLAAGAVRLPREQAVAALQGSNVDLPYIEKLPRISAVREAAARLWNTIHRYIGPAIAWAASATDNFNRADGAVGANWTRLTGPANDLTIVSNQVRASAVDVNVDMYYNALTPTDNQYVQWKVATWTSGGAEKQWGLLRASTTERTSYFCQIRKDDTVSILEENNGGGQSSVASASSITINVNDIMRCEVSGSNFNFKRNGSSVVTGSDATITSGRVGLGQQSNSTGGQAADNEQDDFEGGDAAATSRQGVIVIQ